MLNLLLVLFLLLMIYWWSEQGLFSAVIHLMVTVLAGLAALAVWEPLTVNLLMTHIPDHAWGVGLLLPFAVALLGLRYVTDKLVPGNLDFHNLVNRIGGGVAGLVIGVLTGGLVIIGLQMTGMPDFLGYQPWALDDRQQPQREQTLVIPADYIAGGFFARLSNRAMGPAMSGNTASRYYRNFAVEAGLYNRSSFPASRRVVPPEYVGLLEDEPIYSVGELPRSLAGHGDLALTADERLVVVGTQLTLQSRRGRGRGAADHDGNFRATPHQVALAYDEDAGTGFAHPVGIIQRGEFRSITVPGTYATGLGDAVRTHWVFRVPGEAEPRFLRVKHARVRLPDRSLEPERYVEQVAELERLITYERPAVAEDGPTRRSTDPDDRARGAEQLAVVSPIFPNVDRNLLLRQNVEAREHVVYSGSATITNPGRPGPNLRVNRIHHADNVRLVQVRLGERGAPGSLIGQLIRSATAATPAPTLHDHHGTRYFPTGYIVYMRGQAFRFSIDLSRSYRSLADLDIGRVSDGETLVLIYQVEAGVRVTEFRYADETVGLNLQVPSN